MLWRQPQDIIYWGDVSYRIVACVVLGSGSCEKAQQLIAAIAILLPYVTTTTTTMMMMMMMMMISCNTVTVILLTVYLLPSNLRLELFQHLRGREDNNKKQQKIKSKTATPNRQQPTNQPTNQQPKRITAAIVEQNTTHIVAVCGVFL